MRSKAGGGVCVMSGGSHVRKNRSRKDAIRGDVPRRAGMRTTLHVIHRLGLNPVQEEQLGIRCSAGIRGVVNVGTKLYRERSRAFPCMNQLGLSGF